jgi:hypothetical protein
VLFEKAQTGANAFARRAVTIAFNLPLAGDLANPLMPSVTVASSYGATAGIFAQQSILV